MLVWTDQTRRIHEVDDDYGPTAEKAIAFYATEARPQIQAAMQKALATGISWDLELAFTTARGRSIWVRASGEAEIAGGAAVRLFGAVQDITERKHADQALLDSERRLRMIADNLPALVSYIDSQERYRFVNAHIGRIFGVVPESMLGRTMREIRGEVFYSELAPHIGSALRGDAVSFQNSGVAQGQLYHYQSNYIPDFDASGTVAGFYAITFDITALKETQSRLDALARTDALTGLANRRQFEERLQQAMARSRRTELPMALMFLDVDHFKRVNDSFGHAAGDIVLREFARRLEKSIRITDLVARLTGDEFVLLLESVKDQEFLERIADKLVESLRLPISVGRSAIVATASVGVVRYDGGQLTMTELMANADNALYTSKAMGRDQFHLSQTAGQSSSADLSHRPKNVWMRTCGAWFWARAIVLLSV